MEAALEIGIVDVDRLKGDLIIYFNDGERALYVASLLRSMLTQATEIADPDDLNDSPRLTCRPKEP